MPPAPDAGQSRREDAGQSRRDDAGQPRPHGAGRRAVEVFLAFLRLGLSSFGGPVAHLGYFRTEFVERRRWLDDRDYSDLVALCQFLPGPASSQVGIGLGLSRAGWAGALAAWCGFTLPSAFALVLFAWGIGHYAGLAASGAVHGLKVVAVAVVAQAVWGMSRSLCPDRPRAAIAIGAALLTLLLPTALAQVGAIVVAGLVGWRWLALPAAAPAGHRGYGVSARAGAIAIAIFLALLVALPVWAAASGSAFVALLDGFYRAGALVFGGGHVVLPLLQSAVVPAGFADAETFIAGYGAAQAVPGPLFTFAAFLGTVAQAPDAASAGWGAGWIGGWRGGLAMLVAIFVPAFLLVVGALPFWEAMRRRPGIQSTMAGINAGVVGILLAALYDPVWTSAIRSREDFALALAAFGLLVWAKASPLLVVALAAAGGWLIG
ncbi:chromate efflux transporter [Zeimonas sediminis]|uniref:chromate efflux transporter n=1 Tax=Zeimonas sediminis TaxID=2944268 RepID=UPI003AEF9B02